MPELYHSISPPIAEPLVPIAFRSNQMKSCNFSMLMRWYGSCGTQIVSHRHLMVSFESGVRQAELVRVFITVFAQRIIRE